MVENMHSSPEKINKPKEVGSFESLYETQYERVFKYCLRRTGNFHTSEDVTGQIFLKAFAAFPSYEERGSPIDAWLMRIARNEVVSLYRRSGHETELFSTIKDDVNTPGYSSVETAVERKIAAEQAFEEIQKLSPAQKEVAVLRFRAGLSIAETAAFLGKNENTVKVNQNKAMEKIRQRMGL